LIDSRHERFCIFYYFSCALLQILSHQAFNICLFIFVFITLLGFSFSRILIIYFSALINLEKDVENPHDFNNCKEISWYLKVINRDLNLVWNKKKHLTCQVSFEVMIYTCTFRLNIYLFHNKPSSSQRYKKYILTRFLSGFRFHSIP
jgi:hypothetical protein